MINFSSLEPSSQDFCSSFLTKKSLVITLSSFSMGTLYKGYQIGIINTTEWQLDRYFSWGDDFWCYITLSSILFCIGGGFGAFFSSKPANILGRRRCLLMNNAAMGILSALNIIPNFYSFIVFRFFIGVCVGVCSSVPPIFINEIAPRKIKTQLSILIQLLISFGILMSFAIGWGSYYLLNPYWSWACPYLFPLLPIFLQSYLFSYKYKLDTPKWFLMRSRQHDAEIILKKIYKPWAWQSKLSNLESDSSSIRSIAHDLPGILTRSLGSPSILAYLLCIFQQLTGINFLIFYSSEVLEKYEDFHKFSSTLTIILGICNFLFVFPCFYLIKVIGRKYLLLQGFIGMFLCYAGIVVLSYLKLKEGNHWVLFGFYIVSVLFFETSLGTFVWIFITELMSFEWIGKAICVNWVCAAGISAIYPLMFLEKKNVDYRGLYVVFAFCCLVGFAVVLFYTIEVKEEGVNDIARQVSVKKSFLGEREAKAVILIDR